MIDFDRHVTSCHNTFVFGRHLGGCVRCYRKLPSWNRKRPIIPKIAEMPTSGDHKPGDFFFWTNDSPSPPPGCQVQENGSKMTVFDWGRQVFFSLNYMQVRQTEGLNNWDSTVLFCFSIYHTSWRTSRPKITLFLSNARNLKSSHLWAARRWIILG